MPQQLPLGSIGKYQILELVGEGAMGAVYRALDPVLQRPVAIKVMSDAIAREEELRQRFLREAQAAGSLQHPNVVTIYDFGEVDGHLFIAMEFLDGADLETLLARGALPSLDARLGVVLDVLGGLAYAHRRGIIHRDVKPANIRVTEDGRAKLMDFGVAHLTSQKMTRTGMSVGTPNYMAPEQVTATSLSPATDLFSVGAVLFELLTGQKPFVAATLHGVLFKIVSEATPAPSVFAPDVPPALDAVVARALAKDPAERYQSALEMSTALGAVRAALGATSGATPGVSGAHASASMSLNARFAAPAAPAATTAPHAATSAGARPGVGAARGRGAGALLGAGALVAVGVAAWAIAGQRGRTAPSPATSDAGEVALASPAGAPAVAAQPAAPLRAVPAGRPTETVGETVGDPVPAAPAPPPTTTTAAAGARPRDPGASRATEVVVPRAAVAQRPVVLEAVAPAPSARVRSEAAAGLGVGVAATPTELSTTGEPGSGAPVLPAAREAGSNPAPRSAAAGAGEATSGAAAREIADVVERYARAIEGRNLAAMRAAYPGLTSAQERNFARFFETVRELRATLTLRDLDVRGDEAEARLAGVYAFVTGSGQRQRSDVALRATFRQTAAGWTLASVR